MGEEELTNFELVPKARLDEAEKAKAEAEAKVSLLQRQLEQAGQTAGAFETTIRVLSRLMHP